MDIQNNINVRKTDFQKVQNNTKQVSNAISQETENNPEKVMAGLNSLANINKVSVNKPELKKEEFALNLSTEELKKRTSKDALPATTMLKPGAPEYENLAEGDKEALKHLVKAGKVLEEIHLKLDNPNNIPFRSYLENKVEQGDKDAEMTLKLFNAQKGMNAIDTESNMVVLAKDMPEPEGKGFYPQDLKKEEFHNILINMLENGEDKEVAQILNQRSVVVRNGEKLEALDYTEIYKEDFEKMADELDKAAETSTNVDFNEYMKLQAKALRVADPMADAYADKKWATLQDTPLEFTITRECYDDTMSTSISENKKLSQMLEDRGIQVYPKDSLGCRVGIVNKESTKDLLEIKKYLPKMAAMMPFNDQYEQNIKPEGDSKQTMVDVDLLMLAGDCGAYRGGVTLAENLPNDDKLSLTIGGGRRNVYHRQIRLGTTPEKVQQRLDAVLDPEQHKYYNQEADHWFTIGHENTHSLGPTQGREKLGKYQSIIEENKADMGSISFVDMLTNEGMYTPEQREQILVSYAVDNFLKAKPELSQAHRVRSVMQTQFMIKEGAIEVNDAGKVHVNIDKVVPAAQKMLKEAIRVQLSQDVNEAEKYVNKYFVWDENCEKVAEQLRAISQKLNGTIETPLADKLAQEE
ncbi:MAG: hypothetical protein ACI37T_00920 [Candidatus Gastranaerophilaceae bacterium]